MNNNPEKAFEQLERKIIKLYNEGKTYNEIFEELKEQFQNQYSKEKKYCHYFIVHTIEKYRKTLTIKEKEKLDLKRNLDAKENCRSKKNNNEQDYPKEYLYLEKRIYELFNEGYTTMSIIEELSDELNNYFNYSQNNIYLFVDSIGKKFKKNISSDEYARVLKDRQKIKKLKSKESKIKLVEKVKKSFNNSTISDKEKRLKSSIKIVSNLEGIQYDILKRIIKEIDIDFYNSCIKKPLTVEEMNNMANKIIVKDIKSSNAYFMDGYSQMIKYIKANKPEIYDEIKKTYAKHKK